MMNIQTASDICWYMLVFWSTRKKYLTYSLLMPRRHFRNRSHPGKGMCRMGAVSGVHGHESGFDLSLWFSRWASDSAYGLCSQMTAPRWQMEGHPRHCMGPLLLPELPHAMGPQLLDAWPSSTAAGDVLGLAQPCLLLPVCLTLLSYAPARSCPVVLLPPGCIEFSIITIYSADAMQNSQWGWACWTQEKHC